MSESLNRAFIKAYDKEKLNAARREAQVAARQQQAAAELIMQFDTATVAIPTPHVFTPRTSGEPVRVAAPSNVPPVAAARASDASPRPSEANVASGDHEDSLRASIAAQMLRAGDWSGESIDAFVGGFPMISTIHALGSRGASVRPIMASGARTTDDRSDDAPSATPPPEQPGPPAPPVRPANSSAPPVAAPTASPAAAVAANSPQTTRDAAQATADATSPTEPALKQPAPPPAEVAAKLDQRSRDGDIFRLDRPTYAPPAGDPAEPVEETAAAAHDSASPLQSHLGRTTVTDRPTEKAAGARSSHSASRTRNVEDNLRRARARIFNPVWEVDHLQWPAVCLELLDSMNSNMNRVANNLMTACQEGLQVMAVTSPQIGEGSTTVACCLAMLAGSHGLKVAIVDGDIDNPSLSYQANLEVDQDWRAAILNQLPLEEIAVHSIDDQLTLLPLLNPISHHEMSTDDDRIAMMLQELSESFDLVIVDMGHMNSPRSLVTTLGEQGLINAVVAVVDRRSSSPERIEACLRRIRQSGVASIGLVENFAA